MQFYFLKKFKGIKNISTLKIEAEMYFASLIYS